MNIAYLQVDLRYNKWLLKKIRDKYVVEYTLDRIRELDCEKIIAGIYNCKENESLIKFLTMRGGGVDVILSEEENVNLRFMNLMLNEDAKYIIRVGGDQIFLDNKVMNKIIEEMNIQGKELFYHSGLASVLPDVVSVECLNRWKDKILQKNRYFEALEDETSIDRYRIPDFCALLYDFRINSNMNYRICKHIMDKNLDIYSLSMKLSDELRYRNNYLNRTGILGSWILGNSYEDFFWDESNKVNPWWGKSVIDLVSKKLKDSMRVFEWGMGNSTLFWSQYVAEVVSIESDIEWYNRMTEIIPSNVRAEYCLLEYGGEYCQKILNEEKQFDIILIDGRDRVRCAYNSVVKLKEDGVIIWDNTEREEYQSGYDFLKEQGFKQLELESIIYGIPGAGDCTSIFYRENNVLEI